MEKKLNRREVFAALPALAAVGASSLARAQARASEYPAPQNRSTTDSITAPKDKTGEMIERGTGMLTEARAFPYDLQPVRKMANGGESRNIAHGVLATGETVNLHQSMQLAGTTPNPPHVIEHSEFILVREGELEFEHEVNGRMISERVGPGGVIYVAYGTRHTIKNAGDSTAEYFVVAIGGDAK